MDSAKEEKSTTGSSRLSFQQNPTPSKSTKRTSDTQDDAVKSKKISIGMKSTRPCSTQSGLGKKLGGFQMKFNTSQKKAPASVQPLLNKPPAAIFNESDDDEPEEMPPEAKMRMRNIGRDTPTSAGPNSFGKTKQGFCNQTRFYDKALKNDAEQIVGLRRQLDLESLDSV